MPRINRKVCTPVRSVADQNQSGQEDNDDGVEEESFQQILESIRRIRGQKQRPGKERICAAMNLRYGVLQEDTLVLLERAVQAGRVIKLINKGMPSYRDPQTLSVSKPPLNPSDTARMIKKGILTVNLEGASTKEIEESIRVEYGLVISTELIRNILHKMVEAGKLDKHGRIYKVPIFRMDPFPSPKVSPSSICRFCLGTSEQIKQKTPEELVSCHDCGNSGHPSCLKYSKPLVQRIKAEPWLCLECKRCVHCDRGSATDDLLFCDACDKGFHMECLDPPLEELPKGRWICPICIAPCAAMNLRYGVLQEDTPVLLEGAVQAGRVIKLINKGMPSYRDPQTLSVSKPPLNPSDTVRMIKKGILTVNLEGTSTKEIDYNVHYRACLHHYLELLGAVCTLQGVPIPLLRATRNSVYTTGCAYTIT